MFRLRPFLSSRHFLVTVPHIRTTSIRLMSAASSEIVDDSEPEREALRAAIKEQRKHKRKRPLAETQEVLSIHQSDSEPDIAPSFIELSSDFVEIVHSPRPIVKTKTPPRVVPCTEISETDEDIPSRVLPRRPLVATIPSVTQPEKSTLAYARPQTESRDQNSQESPKVSRFKKYALNTSNALPKVARATSIRTVSTEAPKAPRKISNKFEDEFSSAELAFVRACPSCDATWSTRKTGALKLTHIRTCAKKHALADDTVRTLMRKIISDAQGDTKEEDKPEQQDLKTVYEELAPGQAGIKQRKRLQPLNTIKVVSEARNGILERARSVLGEVGGENLENTHFSARTQAMQPTGTASAIVDQTQAFAESSLAARHRRPATLFQDEDESVQFTPSAGGGLRLLDDTTIEDDDTKAPATQAFQPSKFSGPIYSAGSNEPSSSSPISLIDLTKPRKKGAIRKKRSKTKVAESNGVSPTPFEPVSPGIQPIRDDGVRTWDENEDDAIIHYIPKPAAVTSTEKTDIPTTSKPRSRSPNKPTIKSVSKKRAKLAKTKETVEETDVDFEQTILARIKADQEFHLRILRYEPIHIDVFADLAEIEGTRKNLRQKLIRFLDALGVSYSTEEPTGRHRRR